MKEMGPVVLVAVVMKRFPTRREAPPEKEILIILLSQRGVALKGLAKAPENLLGVE